MLPRCLALQLREHLPPYHIQPITHPTRPRGQGRVMLQLRAKQSVGRFDDAMLLLVAEGPKHLVIL